MSSIPETRMIFLPGFKGLLPFLSGVFWPVVSRMVFFGLYVFWDIPCRLMPTKLENAKWIQLIILSFFLHPFQGLVLSQNSSLPEKFIVRIAGDETQKFSTKGEFHDPGPAFSSILQKLKALFVFLLDLSILSLQR